MASKDRKQPSKQERQQRQAAARAAEQNRKQRRGVAYAVSLGIVGILVVFGVMGQGLRGNKKENVTTDTTSPIGQVSCPRTDGESPRQLFFEKEPPRCIDATRTYIAKFDTSAGKFEAELYPSRAFRAVNNFVFLARFHFYDGLPFHRVSKDTFIQSGDPVAPGITGPGYVFADDGLPASNNSYQPGALLFAHEKSNDNGSQFLIISGPGGQTLNPTFPLFGQVTKGLDVVMRVNAGAGQQVGTPAVKYVIRTIEIEVKKD